MNWVGHWTYAEKVAFVRGYLAEPFPRSFDPNIARAYGHGKIAAMNTKRQPSYVLCYWRKDSLAAISNPATS